MSIIDSFVTEVLELRNKLKLTELKNETLQHWIISIGLQNTYKMKGDDFFEGDLKQIYDAFDADNSRFSYSFGGRYVKTIEFYYKKPNGVLVELKTLSMFRDFIEKDRVGFVIE